MTETSRLVFSALLLSISVCYCHLKSSCTWICSVSRCRVQQLGGIWKNGTTLKTHWYLRNTKEGTFACFKNNKRKNNLENTKSRKQYNKEYKKTFHKIKKGFSC